MYSGSRLGLGLVHIDRRYKKNVYGFNFLPVVLLFLYEHPAGINMASIVPQLSLPLSF